MLINSGNRPSPRSQLINIGLQRPALFHIMATVKHFAILVVILKAYSSVVLQQRKAWVERTGVYLRKPAAR